jgi:hypothetical protein
MFLLFLDKNMSPGDLSTLVLRHVKKAIEEENGILPEIIETGATIEMKNYGIDAAT